MSIELQERADKIIAELNESLILIRKDIEEFCVYQKNFVRSSSDSETDLLKY